MGVTDTRTGTRVQRPLTVDLAQTAFRNGQARAQHFIVPALRAGIRNDQMQAVDSATQKQINQHIVAGPPTCTGRLKQRRNRDCSQCSGRTAALEKGTAFHRW